MKKKKIIFVILEAFYRTSSVVFRTYFYILSDCIQYTMLNYIIVQFCSSKIHLGQQDHSNPWILEAIRSIHGSMHNMKMKPLSHCLGITVTNSDVNLQEFLLISFKKWGKHPHFSLWNSTEILMSQINAICQNYQQHLKHVFVVFVCLVMHLYSFKERGGPIIS